MASIQGRGALIAYRGRGPVLAASANAEPIFGTDPIGKDVHDLLGKDALHAVRNTSALPLASERSVFSGRVGALDLHAFVEAGFVVVEAERASSDPLPDAYSIERDVALIASARDPDSRAGLVRTLSGFGEVEIVAKEDAPTELVPEQGLFVMGDITCPEVPVIGECPPLSRASLRQPPETTLEPLRANGIAAITVLSGKQQALVLRHRQPRVPNHRTRLVLLHLAKLL